MCFNKNPLKPVKLYLDDSADMKLSVMSPNTRHMRGITVPLTMDISVPKISSTTSQRSANLNWEGSSGSQQVRDVSGDLHGKKNLGTIVGAQRGTGGGLTKKKHWRKYSTYTHTHNYNVLSFFIVSELDNRMRWILPEWWGQPWAPLVPFPSFSFSFHCCHCHPCSHGCVFKYHRMLMLIIVFKPIPVVSYVKFILKLICSLLLLLLSSFFFTLSLTSNLRFFRRSLTPWLLSPVRKRFRYYSANLLQRWRCVIN